MGNWKPPIYMSKLDAGVGATFFSSYQDLLNQNPRFVVGDRQVAEPPIARDPRSGRALMEWETQSGGPAESVSSLVSFRDFLANDVALLPLTQAKMIDVAEGVKGRR